MTGKFINGYPRNVGGKSQTVGGHWRGNEKPPQGNDSAGKPSQGLALNQGGAKPLVKTPTDTKDK